MSSDKYNPLSENPHIKNIEEYERLYKESIENPEKFFQTLALENISWIENFDKVNNLKFANMEEAKLAASFFTENIAVSYTHLTLPTNREV